MHIKVESFGKVVRTGVAKTSGHQYIFAEGYLMIEGSQYPERFEYYCATQDDVLPPGIWHVPVTVSLREGRLSFFLSIVRLRKLRLLHLSSRNSNNVQPHKLLRDLRNGTFYFNVDL